MRPEGRRTAAEPLTASWRVDPAQLEAAPRRRRLLATYGWRMYVIPLLIIITIVVLLNTIRPAADGPAGAAGPTGPPVATEHPAVPVPTGSGTAALPSGPAVPQAGAGTWHIVPGNGPMVGNGARLYRYQVAVEDGVDPAAYGGDDGFARIVTATLADPRGWIAGGTVSFQRVDAGFRHPDFVISLTTQNTDHRPDLCGFVIAYEASCWQPRTHRLVIDLARWVRGALAFNGDLGLYRQFAINHEIGRVLGNPEIGCPTDGGLAPVMMAQSFGVADDYVHDLNQVDPAVRATVPRDGKVCRVNAWPFPQGSGAPADNPPN